MVVGRGRFDPEDDHQRRGGRAAAAATRAGDEERSGDRAPHGRWQLQEGQSRERHDAAEASEDIEAVGLEGLEPDEGACHTLATQAIRATASTKRTVRMTHRGNGSMPKAPVERSPRAGESTGNKATNATMRGEGDGREREEVGGRRTRRNPIPMPRKLASSTKFVR